MLIFNANILTMNTKSDIIIDGAAVIKDGKIFDVGKSKDLLKKYKSLKKHDAGGKILMPGLINAHSHLYSTFACGIALKSSPPKDFPQILEKLWWRLDKALNIKSVRTSALIPLISAIKLGTTTLIDHHSSPNAVSGSLSSIADCYREVGLRGVLCYEVTDRNGEKNAMEGIEENIRFLKEIKNSDDDNYISGLFGLHASFTLKDKTLAKSFDAAKSLDAGFHLHLAEDISDRIMTEKRYRDNIIKRLIKYGILGKKTVAAHCIHLNNDEIKVLGETQTKVIHNPRSNMNNAVGRMKIEEMAKNNVLLGLGSDGMSSGMWDEMKTAFLIHKHDLKNPNYGWQEVFKSLFITNPKIAGEMLNTTLGVIEKGAAADMIIIDYKPFTPLTSENMMGHIYFKISESTVDSTIVGGKFLMKNREIKVLDEDKIVRESMQTAKKVWAKF